MVGVDSGDSKAGVECDLLDSLQGWLNVVCLTNIGIPAYLGIRVDGISPLPPSIISD